MFSVCTWIEHNSEYFSGYNYQLNWFVSELYVLFMNIRIIWYHKGFSFCVTSHIFEHWSHICKPLLISHCIIKTKVLLPQAGDLNRFCRSCLGPSVYLLAKLFKLFGFPTFWLWATWWRLYQARLVRTKLDIYFFIETMYAETIKYWGTNTIRGLTGIKRFKFLYIHHSHISVVP